MPQASTLQALCRIAQMLQLQQNATRHGEAGFSRCCFVVNVAVRAGTACTCCSPPEQVLSRPPRTRRSRRQKSWSMLHVALSHLPTMISQAIAIATCDSTFPPVSQLQSGRCHRVSTSGHLCPSAVAGAYGCHRFQPSSTLLHGETDSAAAAPESLLAVERLLGQALFVALAALPMHLRR
jgi:hypothetical protein